MPALRAQIPQVEGDDGRNDFACAGSPERSHGCLFDPIEGGPALNFGGLVLGCIDADFYNQILIGKHFSRPGGMYTESGEKRRADTTTRRVEASPPDVFHMLWNTWTYKGELTEDPVGGHARGN